MPNFRKNSRLPPVIIAHRGASGLYPENTLMAATAAYQGGADLIEIDVRLTRDGHVVVFHDASVERTTDGIGKISNMTLAQVEALDAGFRFTRDRGRTYPYAATGVRVPLLTHVLTALPRARFQIELKDNTIALAMAALELLTEHEAFDRTQIAVASAQLVSFISQVEPRAVLAHPAFDAVKFVLCATLGYAFRPRFHTGFIDLPLCLFRWRALVSRAVSLAAKNGLGIRAYTVNDLDRMKELANIGVDGFFTDYPQQARQIIDALLYA